MLPPLKKRTVKRGRYDGRFRSNEHMAWVRSRFGCAVPGCKNATDRIEAAHITGIGNATVGKKAPDDRVIPLCKTHHHEIDKQMSEPAFEQKYGMALEEMIDDLQRESPILRKLRQAGEYHTP